jgi:cell wall-associated NlpC family hydrolase
MYKDLTNLVGIPWKYRGMTPAEGGVDCWGLVAYAARKFGYDLPPFEEWIETRCDELHRGVEAFRDLFLCVDRASASPGDIALFAVARGQNIDHIGIMISGTHFLHSVERVGSCISRLNGMYSARLRGLYRWQQR